jgi:U3 small nucleolar ribonucleoprotein protein LCP5
LRPRLANFVTDGESSLAEGRGSDGKDDRGQSTNQEDNGASSLYRAPKLSAAPFEEDSREAAKEVRRLERMRGRMRQSEMLQSVRSEVLGTPEEVAGGTTGASGLGGDARAKLIAEDKEKAAWEEDNFMRRQVTKKERQQRKRLMSQSTKLETIADVGDLAMVWGSGPRAPDGDDDDQGGGRKSSKKRRE